MRKVILIPVWLIVKVMQPFLPSTHPIKHEKLTLQWWDDCAKPIAIDYGIALWFSFVCAILIIIAALNPR